MLFFQKIEKISKKQTEIKWVNDIYIDGKKVCGILTEAAFEPGGKKLEYATAPLFLEKSLAKNFNMLPRGSHIGLVKFIVF